MNLQLASINPVNGIAVIAAPPKNGEKGCVCVFITEDLLQSCSRGGGRRVEDMYYERRRAEACVDESAHHAQGSVTYKNFPAKNIILKTQFLRYYSVREAN